MWDVSSNFNQRFDEALNWHRARAPVTPEDFRKLSDWAKRRAFTVAGATSLGAVTAVWDALEKALADGTDFEQFKRDIKARVPDLAIPDHRLETIFRNNIQTAYSAGRYEQMTDPAVVAVRPYWMFDAVLDSRTTRICASLDGKVYPANHPFWTRSYPPLHSRCRSGVRTMTEQEAGERGVETAIPPDTPSEGWGGVNIQWTPDPSKHPPELWQLHQTQQQAVKFTQGQPVSQAFTVQEVKSMLESKRTLEIIDSVHGDGVLPNIPMKAFRSTTEWGSYRSFKNSGVAYDIRINSAGTHKRLTTAHEIGHFLDQQAIGQPGRHASTIPGSPLSGVMQAIQNSQAFQKLQALQRDRFFDAERTVRVDVKFTAYLLNPKELWARAYAQYIAVQSQDVKMLHELAEELDPRGKMYYPKQWTDEDFQPIRDAITLMLTQKGWVQ